MTEIEKLRKMKLMYAEGLCSSNLLLNVLHDLVINYLIEPKNI